MDNYVLHKVYIFVKDVEYLEILEEGRSREQIQEQA